MTDISACNYSHVELDRRPIPLLPIQNIFSLRKQRKETNKARRSPEKFLEIRIDLYATQGHKNVHVKLQYNRSSRVYVRGYFWK
ncbi:hypothetical protein J6590_013577 [Homalodisca vitripennis]|nr:hypothetical protein J6590_013577 [Homalodisca vitripennis]